LKGSNEEFGGKQQRYCVEDNITVLAFKKQLEKQCNLPGFGAGIVMWLSLLRRLLG